MDTFFDQTTQTTSALMQACLSTDKTHFLSKTRFWFFYQADNWKRMCKWVTAGWPEEFWKHFMMIFRVWVKLLRFEKQFSDILAWNWQCLGWNRENEQPNKTSLFLFQSCLQNHHISKRDGKSGIRITVDCFFNNWNLT